VTARRRGGAPYIVDTGGLRSLHFGPARIQSRMRLREPDQLVFDYTRLMAAFLLLQPRPRRAALIGLGGGSLLKFLHRHVAGLRLEVVENDARVIALREEFHIPADSRRLRIRLGDGVRFVREVENAYDTVLLDGYDEQGMPARLRSAGFVAACRRALRPGGLLVINMDSGDAGLDLLLRHLQRAFAGAVLRVSDSDGGNCVVFAGRPLRRRIGEIRRPAAVDRTGWAALVDAVLRLRAAQAAHLPPQRG
jgi:spermidine synthase